MRRPVSQDLLKLLESNGRRLLSRLLVHHSATRRRLVPKVMLLIARIHCLVLLILFGNVSDLPGVTRSVSIYQARGL